MRIFYPRLIDEKFHLLLIQHNSKLPDAPKGWQLPEHDVLSHKTIWQLSELVFGCATLNGLGHNLAVVCGRQSAKRIDGRLYGLLCVDSEKRLPYEPGKFAEPYLKFGTMCHLTPKGFHLYYRVLLPEEPTWERGISEDECLRIAGEDHARIDVVALFKYLFQFGLDGSYFKDMFRFTSQYALIPPSVIFKQEGTEFKPRRYDWVREQDIASGMTPIKILELEE